MSTPGSCSAFQMNGFVMRDDGARGNYSTEMCSGSEASSYVKLKDFVYHATLGSRVIKKNHLETTQGKIDSSLSQLPFKCSLPEAASMGD